MNHYRLSNSNRERFRKDFNNQFLRDILDEPIHGHDPRNRIGHSCGFSYPRALQIAQDRVMNSSIWSDLPDHVNHVPGA